MSNLIEILTFADVDNIATYKFKHQGPGSETANLHTEFTHSGNIDIDIKSWKHISIYKKSDAEMELEGFRHFWGR